jgi:hypothetical protein
MKSQLKINKYKINLITKLLQKETLFFFQMSNFSTKNFKKLKLNFEKSNLNFLKINTKLTQNLLKNSKLKNFLNLVEGPLLLSYFKTRQPQYIFENLLKLDDNISFLGLKHQKKLHSIKQINSLNIEQSKINYILTMKKSPKKLCLSFKKSHF